jgi:hypothetical protein
MQGIFDNILGEIEPYIEEVATRTPTGFYAIAGSSSFFANGSFFKPFKMFWAEAFGCFPFDFKASKRNSSRKETHDNNPSISKLGK